MKFPLKTCKKSIPEPTHRANHRVVELRLNILGVVIYTEQRKIAALAFPALKAVYYFLLVFSNSKTIDWPRISSYPFQKSVGRQSGETSTYAPCHLNHFSGEALNV